ncbi:MULTISPECIES: hypothetical protein [unclassified Micromonospora]|uniref:hypothetical protein n=1 Tax=unclassified Micromonospora TaxID=2617518 RepID=UPI002FF16EE5
MEFLGALDTMMRIRATLPLLDSMVDPQYGDLMLARALWQLAELLDRRQEIRRVRDRLIQMDYSDLPADSLAVFRILAQIDQVRDLWSDNNGRIEKVLADLRATLESSSRFIRERRAESSVNQTLQEIETTLLNLAITAPPHHPDASENLSETTIAVLNAYKELSRQYGTE